MWWTASHPCLCKVVSSGYLHLFGRDNTVIIHKRLLKKQDKDIDQVCLCTQFWFAFKIKMVNMHQLPYKQVMLPGSLPHSPGVPFQQHWSGCHWSLPLAFAEIREWTLNDMHAYITFIQPVTLNKINVEEQWNCILTPLITSDNSC